MTIQLRWYVIHVYSGSEKKVAEQIKEQVEKKQLTSQIAKVMVPVEGIFEVKKGVKVNSERNFFPGYVLIQMVLNDDTWHLVNEIQRVTSFLGTKGKPSPISEKEVNRILSQVEEHHSKPQYTVLFEIGDQVNVCDGPFSSFSGVVEDIDSEKQRLKVSVLIFGRPTPVDLDYTQVEKK